jgi:hypothetical protein
MTTLWVDATYWVLELYVPVVVQENQIHLDFQLMLDLLNEVGRGREAVRDFDAQHSRDAFNVFSLK